MFLVLALARRLSCVISLDRRNFITLSAHESRTIRLCEN